MVLGAAVPFVILYIHRYSAQSEKKVSALEQLKEVRSGQAMTRQTLDEAVKDLKIITEKVGIITEKLGIMDFRVKAVEAEQDRRRPA